MQKYGRRRKTSKKRILKNCYKKLKTYKNKLLLEKAKRGKKWLNITNNNNNNNNNNNKCKNMSKIKIIKIYKQFKWL